MNEDTDSTVPTETRRLAAIMFTDIVGFSRQMGADEARMLRLLETHNQLIHQAVSEHHGHVIKSTGDGFLVEFPSVVHAVQCAQRLQVRLRASNADKEHAEQLHIRIGVHLGDIVVHQGDVQGDGVNIAARLQPLAEPDTICISQKVYEEVAKKLPLGTVVPIGKPKLKNIAQRFPAYVLFPEPPKGLWQTMRVHRLKLKPWQRTGQVGLLLVLLLGVGVLGRQVYQPAPASLPLPDKPSIVVLPFTNMSGDPGQEYFSDGLTEDLITNLSKFSGLFVIARNSAFTYKGKAVKVQEVSQDLGVRYVLEGSVRKAENRVRITAQLVDALRGAHLWAESYDRELKDIFALQDDIRQQVVTALQLKVGEAEIARAKRTPTHDLTAYDYLLRGAEYHNRFTKEAHVQARRLFEQALALDPQYAAAYLALGWSYWLEWVWQWSDGPQAMERAFALAQQALSLNDSLAEAHTLLGSIYLWRDHQYEQAIAEGERALALDPNCGSCYALYGQALSYAGRPQEAIGLIEKGMRLDPCCTDAFAVFLAEAYLFMERYEETIAPAKQLLIHYPDNETGHLILATSYSALGWEEEARAEAAEVLRIHPNFSVEAFGQTRPMKDRALRERLLAALRKAGLK
jgi:adenylate cyclase